MSPSQVRVPRVSIGHPPAPAKEPAKSASAVADPSELDVSESPVYGATYLFDLSSEVKDLGRLCDLRHRMDPLSLLKRG